MTIELVVGSTQRIDFLTVAYFPDMPPLGTLDALTLGVIGQAVLPPGQHHALHIGQGITWVAIQTPSRGGVVGFAVRIGQFASVEGEVVA